MAAKTAQCNFSRRTDDQAARSHTTRLPQRSVTPSSASSHLPTPNQSKLQKRRLAKDEPASAARSATFHQPSTSRVLPMPKQPGHGATLLPSINISKTHLKAPSSRLPRFDAPGSTRTPSLASGSSTSIFDSPRSNVLRRKPSSIGKIGAKEVTRPRKSSMSSSKDEVVPTRALPGGFKDPFSETVLGISLPPSSMLARSDAELEGSKLVCYDIELGPTEILPLPTPQYAMSATPSTRYSESPGPFSVSSTPTSMSSYSPATALSTTSTSRLRQASPLQSRPPIARHHTPEDHAFRQQHGLPSVRETSTPSTSSSTILAPGLRAKDKPSTRNVPFRAPNQPAPTAPQQQAPPELAHLADNSASTASDPRRPRRPSRSGTADMVGLREPSPVIQSNMAAFPSHRRTSSTESRSGISLSARTRFGVSSKPSSRQPSPSLSISTPQPPASRLPTREPTPDVSSDAGNSRPRNLSSASPSKTSRFGFFRRKTEPLPLAKQEKAIPRRGPAAGTGHEGYGRYAVRGRSGSSVSGSSIGRSASAGTTTESLNRTPSTRKSSMTSTASTDVDDFFLERLAPVTIRGTGASAASPHAPDTVEPYGKVNAMTGTEESKRLEKPRPTLLPSAMSDPVRTISPMKKIAPTSRRPSESDDEVKRSFLPSLTMRRPSRASKVFDGAALEKVVSSGSNAQAESKSQSKKEKQEKATSKPSRRWNFFQRAHAAPKEPPKVEVPASTHKTAQSRSVAHYALLDAQPAIDLDDIEQLMHEDDSVPDDVSPEAPVHTGLTGIPSETKERLQSILLPPKPEFLAHMSPPSRPASPKVYLRATAEPKPQPSPGPICDLVRTSLELVSSQSQGDLTPVTDLSPASTRPNSPPLRDDTGTGEVDISIGFSLPLDLPPPGPPPTVLPPRPSRLPQVGRIPKVVSRRPLVRSPPPQSFSRPFAGGQPPPSARSARSNNAASPTTVAAGSVEPYPVLRGLDALSHGLAIATISPAAEASSRQSEFFKMSPRKDSEVSCSTSSGAWSFLAAVPTAVQPVPGAPQSEDEVWGEYDDLIDEVLSPVETGHVTKTRDASSRKPSSEPLSARPSAHVRASSDEPAIPSLHLRRSRLLAVLHSAQSPTSPMSISDYVQNHGERRLSVLDPVTGRLSFPKKTRTSTGSVPNNRASSTRSSLPASLAVNKRQSLQDSRRMEAAEAQSDGLVSMANLRFGALMTSKWLSFGRVLFSPAHSEMKNPKEDRILVIDGLGKDWSYYCALTYPEASIYNLGSGPSSTANPSSDSSEPWSTLRNHRHVSHESLASPFPFPRGFFASVVLRFPPALPSSVHRSIISECKRVLRPGGHLEFFVLDLDLVNMGNRARKAIRGLKVKLQAADEHISLRNISDEMMAGLGRKGFTECNRCFVGVPVAGSLSSHGDVGTTMSPRHRTGRRGSRGQKEAKAEVSFSDLLNKHASAESTDNGIADMVARVGRWWYSRCYESLVLPDTFEGDKADLGGPLSDSIWRDPGLMSECEERGTSFRLLIGYAQKPEVGVRRTVSV
ncbi:hypothetical protein M011DRAFT_491397 [Sporormia fimetaria CBS 119925]|uniref:Methyltransferase type 11 domain-containing protein n=1 Tax=Sporormia fimetaria CBS 119925 TaxID=1340428 RepID=A0A6A6VMR2_9PLEO|nr:hypothetical protein M011DRAFT_491397 [Sporormia fimetaria CBS 119925]